MVISKNYNSTYLAQKKYNDFTAWRSVPNRIYTSSHLANISLEELRLQELDTTPVVEFDATSSREYYNEVTEGLGGVIGTLDEDTDIKIKKIDQKLFDLKPVLDLFEQGLKASKSSLDQETHSEATERYKQVLKSAEDARNNNSSNLKLLTNVVLDQVTRVSDTSGASGRKIANNIINKYLLNTRSLDTQVIDALTSQVEDFLPDGVIGKVLLEQAEPLMGAAQNLLKKAIKDFSDTVAPDLKEVNDKLQPIFAGLNTVARVLPGNVSSEIEDITQQVLGISLSVDKGLSALKSDGRQLQPSGGRSGASNNSRINAQKAKLPGPLEGERVLYEATGFSGGSISIYPSGYIQNNLSHPRRNTSSNKIVSDKFTPVIPELDNLRFEVLNSYKKMPGVSLRNPEIANGPSLTTPEVEPIVEGIIGNTKQGTIVADLVGTLESSEQIFQPRIG